MAKEDLGKYSAFGPAAARFVAQQMVMKPYVWAALTVHVHGERHLEKVRTPFITTANHSSHLDSTLIYGALPRKLSRNLAAGAAADYFFQNRFRSLGTRLFFNTYPVDRGGMRAHRGMSGRLLDEGIPLLIFAEGTRSRTGAMAPFKSGVAALSISHDVQVLPVALIGAYAAMPYGATLPAAGRPDVHVVFGHPQKAAPGEIAREFSDRLYRYVVELHDTTARAYGMPTQTDFHRANALRAAAARNQPAALESGPAAEASDAAETDAGEA